MLYLVVCFAFGIQEHVLIGYPQQMAAIHAFRPELINLKHSKYLQGLSCCILADQEVM